MTDTYVRRGPLPRCSREGDPTRDEYQGLHGRVVARLLDDPLAEFDHLCKPCLDSALDHADRYGVEPIDLEWVTRMGYRWCGKHFWPVELCRDWSHGPGYNGFGQDPVGLAVRRSVERTRGLAASIPIERWQVE